jgi:hypothetical protein
LTLLEETQNVEAGARADRGEKEVVAATRRADLLIPGRSVPDPAFVQGVTLAPPGNSISMDSLYGPDRRRA